MAKSVTLFKYNNNFYLVFSDINQNYKYIKTLCNILSEFGTYKCNADIFSRKLNECGKIVIKNNAIKTCLKYFV